VYIQPGGIKTAIKGFRSKPIQQLTDLVAASTSEMGLGKKAKRGTIDQQTGSFPAPEMRYTLKQGIYRLHRPSTPFWSRFPNRQDLANRQHPWTPWLPVSSGRALEYRF